jgi:hypothetical protein
MQYEPARPAAPWGTSGHVEPQAEQEDQERGEACAARPRPRFQSASAEMSEGVANVSPSIHGMHGRRHDD